MDIQIIKEDLSKFDCGGAYREVEVTITVDSSLSLIMQRQSLVFEILSLYLDPLEYKGDLIDDISHTIAESLEILGDDWHEQ